MPEAIAVLFVLAAAIGVYVWAALQSRHPANQYSGIDLERLRNHEAWLKQRLQLARQEKWSGDMIARITADLAAATQKLAKAIASPPVR